MWLHVEIVLYRRLERWYWLKGYWILEKGVPEL